MDKEDEDWLLEHMHYEWSMLNYTAGQISTLPPGNTWNSHCESFGVHARLVALFLTNNDTGNYGATAFVPGFRSRLPDPILKLKNKIDPQIMHLSAKRTAAADRKLNSTECAQLYRWLADEFEGFLERLPEGVRAKWGAKAGTGGMILYPPSEPSSTNYTSTTTATVYPTKFP